jgi:GntR family transcriptional regulator
VPHKYEDIAAELAELIDAGVFAPSARLPGIQALARHYGVGHTVMQEVMGVLELSGRVAARPGSGTYILDNPETRQRIDIGRQVRRNEFGYLFGKPTGHWSPLGTPSREWTGCPADVADVLGVSAGAPVFSRRRVVGPSSTQPMQLTTTYIREDLAKGTVLEHADTGPGGYLERLERDMGHGPLAWTAEVWTRLPTGEEAADLGISSRLPVLVTTRVHRSAARVPLAVDVAVVNGRRFAYRFPLSRTAAAQWPTTPATGRNQSLSPGRRRDMGDKLDEAYEVSMELLRSRATLPHRRAEAATVPSKATAVAETTQETARTELERVRGELTSERAATAKLREQITAEKHRAEDLSAQLAAATATSEKLWPT